jgi:hypothetical protein
MTFADWLRQVDAATEAIRDRTENELSVIVDDRGVEDPGAKWSVDVSYSHGHEVASPGDVPALLPEIGAAVKAQPDELADAIAAIPEPDEDDQDTDSMVDEGDPNTD